jgi:NADPH:quinone reductase-like Zn-dependent oxidoreductase
MPDTIHTGVGTMKAIVQDTYGTADVLELRDIARPDIGDGEMLVRVHAAGVDPSVWHSMTGVPYIVRLMGFGLRAPKLPVRGLDVAGRVEQVGRNVTRFQPGDEVFGTCQGSFAEYARVRADRCLPKPASLSFEAAAAVPVSAITALQAVRDKGQLRAGQHVLVIGAGGGVGTYAVQIAKALGAEVTGVSSTAKTDLVRSIGADHTIDYTRDDPVDGSRRYDRNVDCAGNRPLRALRRALTPKGTLVIVGGEQGGRWLGGVQRLLHAALLSVVVGQRMVGLYADENAEDLGYLAELIEAGAVTPVLDRTFPLAEVPDAIRYVQEGRARGKVVVTVQ